MGCSDSKNKPSTRKPAHSLRIEPNEPAQNMQEQKKEVKICFLGSSGVGKTLFYMTIQNQEGNYQDLHTNPGGDNAVRHWDVEGFGKVVAIVWDTAGEETYWLCKYFLNVFF